MLFSKLPCRGFFILASVAIGTCTYCGTVQAKSVDFKAYSAFAVCKPTATGNKNCQAHLNVQPYKGTKFTLEGQVLRVSYAHSDKTLAEAAITLPDLPRDKEQVVVTATAGVDFEPAQILVELSTKRSDSAPLVALNRVGAKHRFLRRISTGKQPKSANFISGHQVVLPLLNDNHSEVVDILTGKVTKLEVPAPYAKKGGFVETVVVPTRGEFWMSQMSAHAVHRYAIDTLAYRGSIQLTGKWTKVLAYDAKRNVVYASNWLSSDISVISVEDLKEIKKIKIGGVPRGMAFSTDGNYMIGAIFASSSDSDGGGRTVQIDLDKLKIVKTIVAGGSHRHAVRLKEGKDHFAVSDMARSMVYFIEDYVKTSEVRVFANPNTIVESPDGKYLYVSCRGHNNPKSYLIKGYEFGRLMVIDLATKKIIENIEAGNQPTGLDVSPDGKYVVLTDFLDHAMRVYERLD
jgi:YVTN family beta-propeller protein